MAFPKHILAMANDNPSPGLIINFGPQQEGENVFTLCVKRQVPKWVDYVYQAAFNDRAEAIAAIRKIFIDDPNCTGYVLWDQKDRLIDCDFFYINQGNKVPTNKEYMEEEDREAPAIKRHH